MKLVTFVDSHPGGERAGMLLDGDRVLDLSVLNRPPAALEGRMGSVQALIEGGAAALDALRDIAAGPHPALAVRPFASVTLRAPIPRPRRNVICVGRNYLDHVAEGDRTRGVTTSEPPKHPQFFTKAPDCVIGPDEPIPPHSDVTKWLDYEAELAVVIGTPGRDIPRGRAMGHVFGCTIANDITGRDLQRRHGQWFKGKSLDRSCPMGPCIAVGLDPSDLAIRLWVNGEKRQDSRTSKMIFDIPEIIAQLSAGFTLLPGDVIMTGTPEGVGYAMQPPRVLSTGDRVEIEIEGIGRLANPVGEAAA